MSWSDRFAARDSALCVGLDPVPGRIPDGLTPLEFCREVVALTERWAACYKANAGFFEQFGPEGMAALARLIEEIREEGIPVIADAKRGDIGSTAEAYAAAWLRGPFAADAVTVNPSVGLDTLEPWRKAARENDAGVFLLLRTSNPGAALFQDASEPALIDLIGSEPDFGAVVGATDPAAGLRLRAALPDTLFLVPGFGAQGGENVAPFFSADGRGAVVNSSRGILYAGEGEKDWKRAVEAAARAAHETLERARR